MMMSFYLEEVNWIKEGRLEDEYIGVQMKRTKYENEREM